MPAIKIVELFYELFYLQKWSGDWNRIYCLVRSVCVFRFVYTLLLKRNSQVKKMSSDSESSSIVNFWSSSDEDIMVDERMMLKKAVTHKLTSRVVSRDVLTARFKCLF